MRLPTDEEYAWILDGMTPGERMHLDEVVSEIVGAEIDGSDPDQLEALAHVFATHALSCELELRGTGFEIAACMRDHAARLRDPLPTN
jgi:hypothetical protein